MQPVASLQTPAMLETGSVIYQAKFIDVNGIRTRYYDEGRGDVLLLIHGSRFSPWGSANTWTRNVGGLAKKFRVLAPIGMKLFEMIREKTKQVEMHIFNNVAHFHYREIPEQWNRVVINFIETNA